MVVIVVSLKSKNKNRKIAWSIKLLGSKGHLELLQHLNKLVTRDSYICLGLDSFRSLVHGDLFSYWF